ncbi:MAG: SBBP repeat-containing protein [Oscillatoriophycideae cyanobacterium NC_groundwater_1537_Pr4_S-0.65um_50_18]|nr:SBBP repeat-containing protein [Oscillatoriophycideae cyanobacterium NC_groundwater_1537_Pr4_S-0.65um_50_18]
MGRDRAGNALLKAKNLGTLNTSLNVSRDAVGKSDLSDLYRVKLGDRSSFNMQIANLGKGVKVGVEIFTLKGIKNKVLKAIGRSNFDQLKGKDLRKNIGFITKSTFSKNSKPTQLVLDAGEYFVRIAPRKGNTAYRLGVFASPISSNVPGDPSNPINDPTSPTATSPVQFNRQWIRQLGTDKNDYGYGVAIVGDNLYISGSTEGNLNGANQGDRDSFAALYNTEGTLQWQRQFGVKGIDTAADIAADSNGNYYIGGVAVGSTFGFPDPNGYVSKYSSNGTPAWQKQIKFSGAEAIAGVATNGSNVYAAGLVRGIPGITPANAYVIKYDSTGKELWSKEWSGSGSSSATGVAIDPAGNVYIAGVTNATLTSNTDEPFTGGDVFLAKYSASGTKLWDQTIATSAREYVRSIAVDDSGNVYITGDAEGTLPGQTSAGGTDGFVAKYSTTGAQQWLKQFGTTGLDESQGIAVSDTGYIFLTGETTGGILGNTNAGGSDAWIAAFGSDGSLAGSTQIGTAQEDEAYGIAASGNTVFVLGQTLGAIANTANQGQYDAWVTKYSVS